MTDRLHFEGPLCGLLQHGRLLEKKRTERQASSEGVGTLGPAAGERGQSASSPV